MNARTALNDRLENVLAYLALLLGFGVVGLYLFRFQELIVLALKLAGLA